MDLRNLRYAVLTNDDNHSLVHIVDAKVANFGKSQSQYLYDEDPEKLVILITSSAYAWEIYKQLESDSRLAEARCFFLIYMITEKSYADKNLEIEFNKHAEERIPKIIGHGDHIAHKTRHYI